MTEPAADTGHPRLDNPAPHVWRITFTAPGKANCLGAADLAAIERHLTRLEADPDARVLVFRAEGKIFGAGFDLDLLVARGRAGESGVAADFERAVDRIEATPLVTIAAIDGPVMGGSTDLALACDLRVGSPKATMLMPAARFGLPLYGGALRRYVSRLGIDHAKRLVLLAEPIGSDEMKAIGVLTEIVASEEVETRALALAAQVAAMPFGPLSAMKSAMNLTQLDPQVTAAMNALLEASLDGPALAAKVSAALEARRNRKAS